MSACSWCLRPLVGKRPHARTCGKVCRQALSRSGESHLSPVDRERIRALDRESNADWRARRESVAAGIPSPCPAVVGVDGRWTADRSVAAEISS